MTNTLIFYQADWQIIPGTFLSEEHGCSKSTGALSQGIEAHHVPFEKC